MDVFRVGARDVLRLCDLCLKEPLRNRCAVLGERQFRSERQRSAPGNAKPGRSQYGELWWGRLAGAGNLRASGGQLNVVLTNLASGNDVDADGLLLVADGALPHVIIAGNMPFGKNSGSSIGALQGVNASTTQATRTPAISINTVTKLGSVAVAYNQEPPAQAASSLTSGIIGLAVSDLADEAAARKKSQS